MTLITGKSGSISVHRYILQELVMKTRLMLRNSQTVPLSDILSL